MLALSSTYIFTTEIKCFITCTLRDQFLKIQQKIYSSYQATILAGLD